jgi:hypothetical protein
VDFHYGTASRLALPPGLQSPDFFLAWCMAASKICLALPEAGR